MNFRSQSITRASVSGRLNRADFLCYGKYIVELKASILIGRAEEAQVVNYLRATGYSVGLLLNFTSPSLQVRRLSTTRMAMRMEPVSP